MVIVNASNFVLHLLLHVVPNATFVWCHDLFKQVLPRYLIDCCSHNLKHDIRYC